MTGFVTGAPPFRRLLPWHRNDIPPKDQIMRLPPLLALAAVAALGLGFGLPAPQVPAGKAPHLAAAKPEAAAPRDLRPLKFSL